MFYLIKEIEIFNCQMNIFCSQSENQFQKVWFVLGNLRINLFK